MKHKYALPIGTVLTGGKNSYRIEEILGQGGYGITYRVSASIIHGNIPITVSFAVKEFFAKGMCERSADNVTLTYSKASEEDVRESLQDFVAEGKRLANICRGCKNIVNVNEVFEANNTAYYVMEYIRGGSLRELVKRQGALSEEKALSYMIPIIRAVGHIHKERLLHLDIKPENIMIRTGEYGNPDEPVLIDFGVTLHFTADGNLTSKHGTYASPGYSPMEQYEGITRFSPETDVYALAATLYYLLVGRDPASAFDIRPGFIEDSLSQKAGIQARRAIVAAMASFAYERTQSTEQFEKLLLDKTIIEKEDNNRTLKFENSSNATKKKEKKEEKRTLAPPYSNGRIVIKVHYPTNDKLSYEFYLGSGVCDTFVVVDQHGKWIYEEDFQMGDVAAFEKKLSELGFLDEDHWEEECDVISGQAYALCEFCYKDGKRFKREVEARHLYLTTSLERLIRETSLSRWFEEYERWKSKSKTERNPNFADIDKRCNRNVYREEISVFALYYDECLGQDMLLVFYRKSSYCLEWDYVRKYVLENDADIIGNSLVDLSSKITNFTYAQTSLVHDCLDDFLIMYGNKVSGSFRCVMTYQDTRDYLNVLKAIDNYHIKHARIYREQHLMAFHIGGIDNTIFRVKYLDMFCDVCPEGGCYEILCSGNIEEAPLFEYDDEWHAGMDKVVKEIDYQNIFPLLIYNAAKWLMSQRESNVFKDIVLENAISFEVHLYQMEHGRVRDDLGILIKAFSNIPLKRTLELPAYCEELMFEIEGTQYYLDIQKDVFSYLPRKIKFTIEVDTNTKISMMFKDTDSGDEKRISFKDLARI